MPPPGVKPPKADSAGPSLPSSERSTETAPPAVPAEAAEESTVRDGLHALAVSRAHGLRATSQKAPSTRR